MNGLYCLKVIEQEGSLVSGTSELRSHLENLQSNKGVKLCTEVSFSELYPIITEKFFLQYYNVKVY